MEKWHKKRGEGDKKREGWGNADIFYESMTGIVGRGDWGDCGVGGLGGLWGGGGQIIRTSGLVGRADGPND